MGQKHLPTQLGTALIAGPSDLTSTDLTLTDQPLLAEIWTIEADASLRGKSSHTAGLTWCYTDSYGDTQV